MGEVRSEMVWMKFLFYAFFFGFFLSCLLFWSSEKFVIRSKKMFENGENIAKFARNFSSDSTS